MPENTHQKAIIYCRNACSSNGNNSLKTQEIQCREYAQEKGYEVVKVIREENISGKQIEQPGIQEIFQILKAAKTHQYIIVINDISRLARKLKTHIRLRNLIEEAGGKLESPSLEFGNDPANQLIESILVSKEQFLAQK